MCTELNDSLQEQKLRMRIELKMQQTDALNTIGTVGNCVVNCRWGRDDEYS